MPSLEFSQMGIEHLKLLDEKFDVIFSMGVLYHHRHPLEQLESLKNALKPGGTLILETIGYPGQESTAFFPPERYAKMRNVFFLPTKSCLENWLNRCHFTNIELIDESITTIEEQRLTQWCPAPKQSLEDFLDPSDHSLTIEGHPAPHRFIYSAKKKGV